MEAFVSIIVPVYNAEKTIERCLCSIRNQTFKNFEVLMVNDGSSDHSMRILNKFAEQDPRFIIIDKSNSGVSDSRNIAMECACGKYFQFVDADDWLPSDSVEMLVNAATSSSADMVICDYKRVINHMITTKGHIDVSGVITKKQYAEYMMKAPANYYYGVMWNKFYRADLIRAHHIKCPLELQWCEDFQFNLEFLQYADIIYVLQEPLYYYVKTKGSLVDSNIDFAKTVQTKTLLFDYYRNLYESLDMYEANRLRLKTFYIDFARDKVKPGSANTLETFAARRNAKSAVK
ncbi:MAG: glycosyltransferase family 2 protein [Bacteroides sp.]